ncbi:hypothetical protein C2G38_2162901 [Gigaspora rosea]|uniref:Uncharacterized protein n=1 Tax=Gigaspora rosea TaxID=44941 RepID=A0A397VXD0_9GLOM|nr:hypothetical protein C2G38_2162901 [Gigaspora rosea]
MSKCQVPDPEPAKQDRDATQRRKRLIEANIDTVEKLYKKITIPSLRNSSNKIIPGEIQQELRIPIDTEFTTKWTAKQDLPPSAETPEMMTTGHEQQDEEKDIKTQKSEAARMFAQQSERKCGPRKTTTAKRVYNKGLDVNYDDEVYELQEATTPRFNDDLVDNLVKKKEKRKSINMCKSEKFLN